MSTFYAYLKLGFYHITDLGAYDHILFIIALCAIFTHNDWKKVVILVTAFTVGHSLTLALAVLQILRIESSLIEFLIPLTIFTTSIGNLYQREGRYNRSNNQQITRYAFAGFFGLIHGLGFSNFLLSLTGLDNDTLLPLLSFNLGIEIGQLMIVALYFLLCILLFEILRFKRRETTIFLSGITAGISFLLLLQNWIF